MVLGLAFHTIIDVYSQGVLRLNWINALPIKAFCWKSIIAITLSVWSFGSEKAAVDSLLQPFTGFDEAGLLPLIELLQADREGRLLLQKTMSRTKLEDERQLGQILSFCEQTDLAVGWERRGLFTQERAYFYRAKGRSDWEDGGTGELKKLDQSKQFPVLAEKRYLTPNFEHREVAFRPKICLKPGMTILQAYLVLYHELVHLTGIDQFDELDLFSFTKHNKLRQFYYQELSKKGGEVEAYLAQLQAFQRLKERYQIPEKWVLEGFLDPKGRLDYRDRDAFMDHLLDKAGYREQLDAYLTQEILNQYNKAYAWWDYIDRLIAHYDENHRLIQLNLNKIQEQVSAIKVDSPTIPEPLKKAQKEWKLALEENRSARKSYRAEQLDLERFMEKVDRYYPRQ